MKYQVEYSQRALKKLKGLDKFQAKLIIAWIENNLVNTENPRHTGKPLKGNLAEYWRYRVGNYRVIARIHDNVILIEIMDVGHRKDIYH